MLAYRSEVALLSYILWELGCNVISKEHGRERSELGHLWHVHVLFLREPQPLVV